LWGRGYFCATVEAVNEDLIKQYVENQEEEDGDFKVWDLEQKTEETKNLSRIDPICINLIFFYKALYVKNPLHLGFFDS
jgi:hypothetical protein